MKPRHRRDRWLLLALCLILLGLAVGCGQKGALYRPSPGPAPQQDR